MTKPLTILVPTRNRANFLRRLLTYFAHFQVDASIKIIDSSDRQIQCENAEMIALQSGKLDVSHLCDNSEIIAKCLRAVESVSTPYSVFCADDDFLMIDTAIACVDFLEKNESYSSAMGSWVSMNPARNNRCHQTRCYPIEHPDPIVRFKKLSKHWFANFYAVYRTDVLRRAWKVTKESTDYQRARVFPETLLAQLTVVYGKLAILPKIHLLFQLHQGNEHRATPLIADPAFANEAYRRFIDAMAAEIASTTDSRLHDCRTIVEKQYSCLNPEFQAIFSRNQGLRRLSRNLKNQVWILRDRMLATPSDVWLRRPIGQTDPLCATDSWRLAFQMASESPDGLPNTHFQNDLAVA